MTLKELPAQIAYNPFVARNTAEILSKLSVDSTDIHELCQRWEITEFAVFGSILRGDHPSPRDVDVVVSFVEGASWSLFDLVRLKTELEKLFERPVDLIERRALKNPFRKREILKSRHVLYAA